MLNAHVVYLLWRGVMKCTFAYMCGSLCRWRCRDTHAGKLRVLRATFRKKVCDGVHSHRFLAYCINRTLCVPESYGVSYMYLCMSLHERIGGAHASSLYIVPAPLNLHTFHLYRSTPRATQPGLHVNRCSDIRRAGLGCPPWGR